MAQTYYTVNKKRFIRQCPHCKSKKGYRQSYIIYNRGHEDVTFTGKIIDADQTQNIDIDRFVECLDCGKSFERDLVQQY